MASREKKALVSSVSYRPVFSLGNHADEFSEDLIISFIKIAGRLSAEVLTPVRNLNLDAGFFGLAFYIAQFGANVSR